ncbi:hypothetical protein HYZ70_00915 [Candidatus Curtissbacteria bacterium]|nr:hypothetical protein [Candidatus Curtissbacteria bacterium]
MPQMRQPFLRLEQVQLTEFMPRGSAHVFFLLLLAVILIWSFAFVIFKGKFLDSTKPTTPSGSQTPPIDKYYSWKIYENEKYKFSLKYPTHWYVREFSDLAANFQETDPKVAEATSAAIKIRFIAESDSQHTKEFEKIERSQVGGKIREPLDVVSTITKTRDFEVGGNRAVEYLTDRIFSALEGPEREYRHTYAIKKDGTILKFIATGSTKEELQVYEKLFQLTIESIKF